MADGTWTQLTSGLDEEDLAKLKAFRDCCRALDGVQERVHTSEITFAKQRIFASAYIKSHYLELGIALLRVVHDPPPRTSFATSKTVTMHRYSLRRLDQFDDAIRALLAESAATVGPGVRATKGPGLV